MTESILELAYEIAKKAHEGQFDKAGKPYIEHPIRVSNNVNGDLAKTVALLHDVVEDTDITFNDLIQMGIPDEALYILRLLTRPKELTYKKYIEVIGTDKIAIQIKLADLEDNMNLNRISNITDRDIQRVEKRYKPAYSYLKQKLRELELDETQ